MRGLRDGVNGLKDIYYPLETRVNFMIFVKFGLKYAYL